MPSLKERIDADLKDAMRSKDELGTSVLRMLKSAVKYKEVEPGGHALEDAGVLAVIGSLIKQRRESVEQFRAGGRPELADKEEKEIARLQTYLPAQMSALRDVANTLVSLVTMTHANPSVVPEVVQLAPRIKPAGGSTPDAQ